MYISFHIRLRGVLWLQSWKSCCQEHRQFGSVRIYHLAGFCAWPLWHQWLGTRNPHLFNHLGSLEIPSWKKIEKNCEAGLACATRWRVSWVTWRQSSYHATACYFLLLLFRAFHVWVFFRLRHDAPKERWSPGLLGKVGPSKSQTHFVAEGKVRKVQSLKGFNTFKKHKTSISC